jgi:DNA processing protein
VQHSINWTTCYRYNYPAQLASIYLPPAVLYWRGNDIIPNDNCLAVVGARKANRYGQEVVATLVPDLVERGWVIVSGGALGIDSMAHKATVLCGGKTVAVLGSGLLRTYPHTNDKLFDQIVDHGGSIVSSFPLTLEALPGHFPARNRIIAGLSRGCLVVQAAQKSGALITAGYALEQGRDVFAVPGAINDPLSAGCHKLLQQGAKLVYTVEDIMQEYTGLAPFEGAKKVIQYASQEAVKEDSSIVSACNKPRSVNDLLDLTGLGLQELNGLLFDLQLNGEIRQDITGMWERV